MPPWLILLAALTLLAFGVYLIHYGFTRDDD